MNPIDWSTLKTVTDWAATLKTIVDAGQAAVTAKDSNAMAEIVTLLGEFQDESPNATCRTLDRIAEQASKDIVAASFGQAVDGIASRSANCYTCDVKFRVTIEPDEDGVFVARMPGFARLYFPRENARRGDG